KGKSRTVKMSFKKEPAQIGKGNRNVGSQPKISHRPVRVTLPNLQIFEENTLRGARISHQRDRDNRKRSSATSDPIKLLLFDAHLESKDKEHLQKCNEKQPACDVDCHSSNAKHCEYDFAWTR